MRIPHAFDPRSTNRQAAMSLLELLVSMSILSIMMLFVFSVLDTTQRVYSDSQAKVEQFREARVAFEAVTRRLEQATLNTYWDYNDPVSPTRYVRQSELHFVAGPAEKLLTEAPLSRKLGHAVFFQAPMGISDAPAYQQMATALNEWGYFLTYEPDSTIEATPGFLRTRLTERKRCRLMEFRSPTERLSVYTPPSGAPSGYKGLTAAAFQDATAWFNHAGLLKDSTTSPATLVSRPIAENIIAFIISPRTPVPPASTTEHDYNVAPQYYYDSRCFLVDSGSPKAGVTRHQLPPTVEVTMVALDEKSANRYESDTQSTGDLVEATWFQNVKDYDADLHALTERLVAKRLNFQIFSTTVLVHAAKWSTVNP